MKTISKLIVVALVVLAQNSFAQKLDQSCIDQISKLNNQTLLDGKLSEINVEQKLTARAGHRGGNGGNSIDKC